MTRFLVRWSQPTSTGFRMKAPWLVVESRSDVTTFLAAVRAASEAMVKAKICGAQHDSTPIAFERIERMADDWTPWALIAREPWMQWPDGPEARDA